MPGKDILVSLFVYNEFAKLKELINKFPDHRDYDLLFVDDGSTDGGYDFLRELGFPIIRHEHNIGIGCGIREAVRYGRENGYKIIVIMAANGKMQPAEIPRLLNPIQEGNFDYVQGSRYLEGGYSPNLPFFRKIMIQLFTRMINHLTAFKGTDATCGFRAYRLSIFDDPRFNLDQVWLNKYEMEYYIHYHTLKGGYKVTEVPVSMVYPSEKENYSKIKPFIGWWSMIRPWIFLTTGFKK